MRSPHRLDRMSGMSDDVFRCHTTNNIAHSDTKARWAWMFMLRYDEVQPTHQATWKDHRSNRFRTAWGSFENEHKYLTSRTLTVDINPSSYAIHSRCLPAPTSSDLNEHPPPGAWTTASALLNLIERVSHHLTALSKMIP
jgi:hypothetical protein